MGRIEFIKTYDHDYFPDDAREASAAEIMQLIRDLQRRLQIAEETNERYRKFFERMVKGDVWMTFDENPVDAYKELAKHALKDHIKS